MVGLFMLAGGIPFALSMLFGGVLADRFSRRNIMVVTDFINGLSLIGLSILFYLWDNAAALIAGIFIVQMLLGINAGFFTPTVYALLPDVLPEERLATGNAVIVATRSGTQVIGKGFGGVIFAIYATPLVILVTGFSFLLSAVSELFINLSSKNTAMTQKHPNNVISDIREGLAYITKHRGLANTCKLLIGLECCLGVLLVNIPFLVQYQLAVESAWYGYLLASLSLGLILGSSYTSLYFNRLVGLSSRPHIFVISLLVIPILYIALAFVATTYNALAIVFFLGASYGAANIVIFTQVQSTTPDRIRGRVLSVLMMINAVILPFSSFFGGIVIDALNHNVFLVQLLSGFIGFVLIYPWLVNKALLGFLCSASRVYDTA